MSSRSISPPPSKRRRVQATSIDQGEAPSRHVNPLTEVPPANQDQIRIYAWNINGVSSFLSAADYAAATASSASSITKYFSPTKAQDRKNGSHTNDFSTKSRLLPSSDVSDTPVASLRTFLRRHKFPHILMLQEVKINPKDTRTQDAVRHAVNARRVTSDEAGDDVDGAEPDYAVHFTLPCDPHNARGFGGKVYGVASIVRKDFWEKYGGRSRTVDWDLEGRINVLEFRVENATDAQGDVREQKWAVFNVYAVNGTDNPYKESATGKVVGTKHDRKLEFHRKLVEEWRTLEADGWQVVVGGDLNVSRDEKDGYPMIRTFPKQHVTNRRDFNAKFFDDDTGAKAVDCWRVLHGEKARGYTWYSRTGDWASSCDRVDYLLVSQSLRDRGQLVSAEIWASPQERGPSDHVPLSITLTSVASAKTGSTMACSPGGKES